MATHTAAAHPNVRAETRALKAFIDNSVETLVDAQPRRPAQEALLFLGAWHEAQPALLIQDPVLEPVDKIIWQVIKLEARRHGAVAFPSYELIGVRASVNSDATIARAIAILRATRWLTLCARSRDTRGRFRGSVYALHDEPLPLADAIHLDADYLTFVAEAKTHHHGRVRAVAAGVLETIDADVAAGGDVTAREAPLTRRLAASQVLHDESAQNARFFSLNRTAIHRLQNLKTVKPQTSVPPSNSKDGASCVDFKPAKFKVRHRREKNRKTTDSKIRQQGNLHYPACLTANERYLAQRYVHTAPTELRQRVLDVLDARLKAIDAGAEPLHYGPLPYLRTLCQRAAAGTLLAPVSTSALSHERASQPSQPPEEPAHRLARSHLINEIRQLKLMIARGADPTGDLAGQVHTLRDKLAALPDEVSV